MAYVAQHSFHHLEEHCDKSPVEYIQWRFAKGVDKEILEKVRPSPIPHTDDTGNMSRFWKERWRSVHMLVATRLTCLHLSRALDRVGDDGPDGG